MKKSVFLPFVSLLFFTMFVTVVSSKECIYNYYAYSGDNKINYFADAENNNVGGIMIKLSIDDDGNATLSQTGQQQGNMLDALQSEIKNWKKNVGNYNAISDCPTYLLMYYKTFLAVFNERLEVYGINNQEDSNYTSADWDYSAIISSENKSYTCEYDNYNLYVDPSTQKLSAIDNTGGKYSAQIHDKVYAKYLISDEVMKWWFNNVNVSNKDCPKVSTYNCTTNQSLDYSGDTINIYADAFIASLSNTQEILKNCEYTSGKDTGCYTYETMIREYSKDYQEYKSDDCNQDCKLQKLEKINTNSSILKSTCNSVLAQLDYNDKCVKSCLNLKNELNIDSKKEINDCYLSDNLTDFIQNIVKWIRYLVPVIVIVLGIIDFIKAISSEKDEEIKKAQGKFIKRLIAAALVFLIPLIIAFILDKFGFVAEGCGIIDL